MQDRLFSDVPGRISQIVQKESDYILALDLVVYISERTMGHESHLYILAA